MKVFLSTLLLLCFVHEFEAQENIGYRIIRSNMGTSGSSQKLVTAKGTYNVSQSIGQASVIGTSYSNGYFLRQGYQQPLTKFKLVQVLDYSLQAIVYPNPFSQSLTISFIDTMQKDISVMIFDVNTRLIYFQEFFPKQKIELKVNTSSGIYFLKVVSGKQHFNTKLIKI